LAVETGLTINVLPHTFVLSDKLLGFPSHYYLLAWINRIMIDILAQQYK